MNTFIPKRKHIFFCKQCRSLWDGNKPPHQDLDWSCHFGFGFRLKPLFASVGMSKFISIMHNRHTTVTLTWTTTWENIPSRDFWYMRPTKILISLRGSVFIVHKKKPCILGYSKCNQWKFWSNSGWSESQLSAHVQWYVCWRFGSFSIMYATTKSVQSCQLQYYKCMDNKTSMARTVSWAIHYENKPIQIQSNLC